MNMNHMIALKSLESSFLRQTFYFYFKYFGYPQKNFYQHFLSFVLHYITVVNFNLGCIMKNPNRYITNGMNLMARIKPQEWDITQLLSSFFYGSKFKFLNKF